MSHTKNTLIKGISVCNPVDIEHDYLMYTIEYAAQKGFNHLQLIGPIHDYVKGNIDGMTLYKKYSAFNDEKDAEYVKHCTNVVNEACRKAKLLGIKTYMWHHELYLPARFRAAYPETLNEYGDIEVSHPIIADFLENKIDDFFRTYPDMDGIILTLHETSIPLLKLKSQKLGKTERVKHITRLLYEACKRLGKELIVRPFASIEEDYDMLMDAYAQISPELTVMDKWTQFDWSLTMPHNRFFEKIKQNPLLVEADIFGEFFGKGRLPLMLDKHITEKFAYCSRFNPAGYVARIDRNGQIPFGDVNEVNLDITNACLNGENVDEAIDAFLVKKYPRAAAAVKALMKKTEKIVTETIYAKGYFFSQLSIFPDLNHSKNHYYFEMMRNDACIDSDEFYIPKDWNNPPRHILLEEKAAARDAAKALYDELLTLENKIDEIEYKKLWAKFCNLALVTEMWYLFTRALIDYVKYFETDDEMYAFSLDTDLNRMSVLNRKGQALLGDSFYCTNGDKGRFDYVSSFINDLRKNFEKEKTALSLLRKDDTLFDYILCGGCLEGHRLQKEVNFSDTLIRDDGICRIAGTALGEAWSAINSHGWFSYLAAVKPNCENTIKIEFGSLSPTLDIDILIGEDKHTLSESICEKKEYTFTYNAANEDFVRIRFDRRSANTPCVYTIKIFS